MTDQRHYQRVSFVTATQVEIDAACHEATLADISLKGALVAFPPTVKPEQGKACHLRIELGSGEAVLAFEGEIAHAHGELAGIRFTRYNLETITHLRRLLELNSADPDRVLSELFTLATGTADNQGTRKGCPCNEMRTGMAEGFKDHFSATADSYRLYRPGYPTALFDWLARVVPRRETALDCGCGNGQAAVALAEHFARVHAVDPSAEQIANAMPHERVDYRVAPAETTGVEAGSVDLIVVAQALHWFDLDRFYAEVRRVARPGAVLAAFTYGLLTVDAGLDRVIARFYYDVIGPFWPPERRHVDDGYCSLPFPFEEMAAPSFAISQEWNLSHLMGYLATWSAVKEYRRRQGSDPLALVEADLAAAWGDPLRMREVRWPLALRVGRVMP